MSERKSDTYSTSTEALETRKASWSVLRRRNKQRMSKLSELLTVVVTARDYVVALARLDGPPPAGGVQRHNESDSRDYLIPCHPWTAQKMVPALM